jgi:hypothetical protein
MSERSETHPLFAKLTEPEEIWRVAHEDPTNFHYHVLEAYGLSPLSVEELIERVATRRDWDDNAWVYREAMRVEWLRHRSKGAFKWASLLGHTGDYNMGRWCLAPAFGDPTKLRYTPSVEYGKADRQIVTTLGKFLTKHYPDLGANLIRDLQNEWISQTKPAAIKFASTPDEVEHVYTHGPHSCMRSGGDSEPDEHAARIYGYCKHTRVAYSEEGGKIVARSVVREDVEPKRYIRVYPNDQHRFAAALEAAGYVEDIEGLDGLLVPAIWEGHRLIMPYVDGIGYGALEGKSVRLKVNSDSRGDFEVQSTSGYAYPDGVEDDSWTCPRCDHTHESDEQSCYSEYEERTFCTACEDDFTTARDERRREVTCHNDNAIYIESMGESVIFTPEALRANGCHQMDDGEWVHESVLQQLEDGEWVRPEDAEENADGQWVRRGAPEQNRAELEDAGQERLPLEKQS